MIWLALTGCLGRQAPAYTWSWSADAPTAPTPGPRQGKVLAVLAGDGGAARPEGALSEDPCTPWNQDAVSLALRDELKAGGELFWLGDNVYPVQAKADDGLGCAQQGGWAMGLAALTRQADAGYRTRAHFVPGNHDYGGHRRERVEAQASLVRQLDAEPLAYLQPVQTVDLGPLAMVAYDTHYAMQIDPQGTLDAIDAAVEQAAGRGKRVALVGHHGLYSVGPHAYHPWRAVLTETDLAQQRYDRWRRLLVPRLELWQASHQVPIVFGGHDHSLQLIQVDQGLHVTSGAGSQTTPVKGAQGPRVKVHHAESSLGYAVLTADPQGRTWVELVAVRPEGGEGCVDVPQSDWYRCRVAAMRF